MVRFVAYNSFMSKTTIIILTNLLLLAGCEKEQQQGQLEHLSEQVEQVKAETQEKEQSQTQQQNVKEPAGTIKITATILTVDERDFEALDSLWAQTTSSFVVKRRVDIFSESGLKVHLASGDLRAQLAAVKENAKYSEQSETSVVLAYGATGYLKLGTGIALPEFHYLTRTYKASECNFSGTGRRFQVRARRIPGRDLINMSMIPFFSHFYHNRSDKKFRELRAGITVKPGQSVLIGATRDSRDSLASALLGMQQESVLKDTVILVSASFI